MSWIVAHGDTIAPHDVAASWSFDPLVLLGAAVAVILYSLGLRRMWTERRVGRGVTRGRAFAFFTGVVIGVASVTSPLDAVSHALFSAHMMQHLILVLVVAPLVVLGRPVLVMGAAARPFNAVHRTLRGARWTRWFVAPAAILAAHTVALWLWHLPRMYEAALRSDVVHALEHFSFFGTAAAFWWVVVPSPRRRLAPGSTVLYLFVGGLQGGALGALLTFARAPLYPLHEDLARGWSLTLLEDQQLAGVIMWVPSGLVYLIFAAAVFLSWMKSLDRRHPAGRGAAP